MVGWSLMGHHPFMGVPLPGAAGPCNNPGASNDANSVVGGLLPGKLEPSLVALRGDRLQGTSQCIKLILPEV
ncbi:MAG: hypothetical protein JO202_15340 [Ktedonobacteraceae bacterium]|nr:hypothetical protein [Ktedonobacteraceae bacterium]